MPFRSQAQRRFMFAEHPGIAKRWQAMTKGPLPERSSGQRQPGHKGTEDFGPGSFSRVPGRTGERDAMGERGVTDEPQSFGARTTHKGLRARDVRAAAVAHMRKGG